MGQPDGVAKGKPVFDVGIFDCLVGREMYVKNLTR